MANRALRLFGILGGILLLLIACGALYLWEQGKDSFVSLLRTELAKSGVGLNSLAWKLEPQGITLENLNLDIQDSRLQLEGLRVTFDSSLGALALEAAKGYLSGTLSAPVPQTIALDNGYVFLGSRSLEAAGSQQASDRAALALNMDNLPLIAIGPLVIDTAAGKLLKLDYLSLTSNRHLLGRVATAQGDKVLDINAILKKTRWQSDIELSLSGAHKLVKHLANSELPIEADNPLALFFARQRALDERLSPELGGELKLTSSLELSSAALEATLSLHQPSLRLNTLDGLTFTLSDSKMSGAINQGLFSISTQPVTLRTQLDAKQRRKLISLLGSSDVSPDELTQASAQRSQTPVLSAWLDTLEQSLLANAPLTLELLLAQGVNIQQRSDGTLTLAAAPVLATAAVGDWQWQLQGKPSAHYFAPQGLTWQGPLHTRLTHRGEWELGALRELSHADSLGLGKYIGWLPRDLRLAQPSAELEALGSGQLGPNDNQTRLDISHARLSLASANATGQGNTPELAVGASELNVEGKLSLAQLQDRPQVAYPSSQHKEAGTDNNSADGDNAASPALTLTLADTIATLTLKDTRLGQQLSPERHAKLELGSANWQLTQIRALTLSAPKPQEPKSAPGVLLSRLMSQQASFSSQLALERLKASVQAPRSDNNKRRKTTTLQLDSLSLTQALRLDALALSSEENWRIGRFQPLVLTSQHKLSLSDLGAPLTLTASWQGDNSLGDWREALANIAGYSPDVRLAGDTHLNAEIVLNFPAQTTDIRVSTQLDGLSGSLGDYPFHGGELKAGCSLHQDKRQSANFFLGCKDVNWKLDHIAPGIVLDHIQGQGSLELESADDGTLSEFDISLTSQGELLKGKFFLPYFKLNLNQPSHAYLVLTGLSLEELLALQPVEGIQASGIFDGVLPVDVKQRKVSVSGGRLAARAPGGLIEVANNPAVDELVSSQPHLALVFDALKHLEYSSLAGDFNMQEGGDATLDIEVKGKSEGIERPIHLNYSHQENLWQLIRSLTVADKLQNQIEQNIN